MHIPLPQTLSLIIGVVLPLLVGVLTKASWPAGVRAVLLLFLAGVTSVLSDLLGSLNGGPAFDLGVSLLTALGTFLVGVGMHFGFWQPTRASAVVQSIGVRDRQAVPAYRGDRRAA